MNPLRAKRAAKRLAVGEQKHFPGLDCQGINMLVYDLREEALFDVVRDTTGYTVTKIWEPGMPKPELPPTKQYPVYATEPRFGHFYISCENEDFLHQFANEHGIESFRFELPNKYRVGSQLHEQIKNDSRVIA